MIKKTILLLAITIMASCDSNDDSVNDEQQQEDSYKLVKTIKTYGDGSGNETTTFKYDSENRVIEELIEEAGETPYAYTYAYNDEGKLISFKSTEPGHTTPETFTYEGDLIVKSQFTNHFDFTHAVFSYNDKNYMVKQSYYKDESLVKTFEFTYDDNGNYITEKNSDRPGVLQTYTYDSMKSPYLLVYPTAYFKYDNRTPNNETKFATNQSSNGHIKTEYEYNDKGYPTIQKRYINGNINGDEEAYWIKKFTYEEL